MAKPQKTTRDTEFNFEKDLNNGTISSIVSYNMTKDFKNVRLLNMEDGVLVTGEKINNHAADNRTLKDLGYENIEIHTGNINDETNYRIYGAPFQAVLNNRQNFNNCGIESTLNTLAMAGMVKMNENLSDQKKVEKTFLEALWELGLSDDDGEIGVLDEPDGGTLPDDYKDILRYFDIDSEAYYFTQRCDDTQYKDINELAYKISQGYGAIVGVCSDKLWQEQQSETGEITIDHAIAITGVVYQEGTTPANYDGEGNITSYNAPVGFYIHDSGGWMSRYISLAEFKEVTLYDYHGVDVSASAEYVNYNPGDYTYEDDKYLSNLREFDTNLRKYVGKQPGGICVTITTNPIKTEMFNLDVTGNSKNNTILGNNSNNVIKGMAGHDLLYGNNGDDELRGGVGNDTIVGNNLSAADKTYLTNTFGINLNDAETSTVIQDGENLIYGDAGNDTLIGGNKLDVIYGGAGNDFIWTGDGRNAAYGEAGNDIVVGGGNKDKLYGDAGNDTLYGYGDDDTLYGGAGNDALYGGKGDDRIETGKGNDTVYFEGLEHGIDVISSQGGTTTFNFDTAIVSDMNFNLEVDENQKTYNLNIGYSDNEDAEDGIVFKDFCDVKSGKSKALNLVDTEDTYNVMASKARSIKTKAENNIIFSLNDKGATITTGYGDDVVTTVASSEFSLAYKTRVDKITYTGGEDIYICEEGDTYYTVKNFDEDTCLAISDNVDPLTRFDIDENGQAIVRTDVVSTNDRLYFDCTNDNLQFFFNVGKNALTTNFVGLVVFDKESFEVDKFVSVAQDNDDISGLVYMDSFFSTDEEFSPGTDFYGNGRIEDIYCAGTLYNYETDLLNIAEAVAGWLGNNDYNPGGNTYTDAFDAFSNLEAGNALTALVQCYTNPMA